MMDDLISRQAAIDALEQIFDRCEEIEAHLPEGDPDRTGYKMYPDYMTVWKYLHQLPSAQPEHKTGHWILDRSGAYCCDRCMEPCATYAMMKPRDKFCKMCGAKMESGEQDG